MEGEKPYEVFHWLLTIIPNFCFSFFCLLSSPKSFVNERNINNNYLKDSFIYFILASLIDIILYIPLYVTTSNKFKIFLFIFTTILFFIICILIFNIIIFFSFYFIKHDISKEGFLITSFYYVGTTSIIFTIFELLGESFLKIADPALFKNILICLKDPLTYKFIHYNSAVINNYLKIYCSIVLAGSFVSSLWFVIGWGAFRKLANVSRNLSILAFIIFASFFLIIYILYWIAFAGLNPFRLLLQ